jgi:hypothetical protein
MKIKTLFLAGLALIASSAVMAGIWNNSFPIVAGSSYCSTTTNGTCTNTVAAGPTALTGNETIPADTNLASGAQPQTVLIRPGQLGAGPTTYNTAVNGDSLTITNTTRRLIITPAGTIAGFTLVFPAATTLTQADNQLFGFCTTQIVTSLTVTAGSGTTVSNAPTAMLVPVATGGASCVEWVYRLSNTTWYRVQ